MEDLPKIQDPKPKVSFNPVISRPSRIRCRSADASLVSPPSGFSALEGKDGEPLRLVVPSDDDMDSESESYDSDDALLSDEEDAYIDVEVDQDGPTGQTRGPGLQQIQEWQRLQASYASQSTASLTVQMLRQVIQSRLSPKFKQDLSTCPPHLQLVHMRQVLMVPTTQEIQSLETSTTRSSIPICPSSSVPSLHFTCNLFGTSSPSGSSVVVSYSSITDLVFLRMIQQLQSMLQALLYRTHPPTQGEVMPCFAVLQRLDRFL